MSRRTRAAPASRPASAVPRACAAPSKAPLRPDTASPRLCGIAGRPADGPTHRVAAPMVTHAVFTARGLVS